MIRHELSSSSNSSKELIHIPHLKPRIVFFTYIILWTTIFLCCFCEGEENDPSLTTQHAQRQESNNEFEEGVDSKNDLEQLVYDMQNNPDIDNGMYGHQFAPDPSCQQTTIKSPEEECWEPPESTLETLEKVIVDATAAYGGEDPDSSRPSEEQQERDEEEPKRNKKRADKHWGSDTTILRMRDALRSAGTSSSTTNKMNKRPPIFLMPGLASTRLVAWSHKTCKNYMVSDVKVQEYVWLNVAKIIEMATIDPTCWKECMKLGLNQTDMDVIGQGCKLRPDEGLDAISSLAPGSISSNLFVGGTNTVYAWLTQWLADNLGYDVSSIIGLPYDWRLSPDKMEQRDGFLTLTKKRIEAAVKSNGEPGIMVAHSMGNAIFRYFLEWLRSEFRKEALQKLKYAPKTLQRRSSTGWMGGLPHVSELKSITVKLDELWNKIFLQDEEEVVVVPDEEDEEEVEEQEKQKRELDLVEMAEMEGDMAWLEWINSHIWTYVGLSAPLLGAINPLRAVISGENMGVPIAEDVARVMELSWGSTHTVNPISTKMGFCDNDDFDDSTLNRANLACLDELVAGIEDDSSDENPWSNFPTLRMLLKDRLDWDTSFPIIRVRNEHCLQNEKTPCQNVTKLDFGPKDVQNGELLTQFSRLWKEEGDPLLIKTDQLKESWWNTPFPNVLNTTWDRPHIKHVIMAYGVDIPTEVGYVYRKEERISNHDVKRANSSSSSSSRQRPPKYDGVPTLKTALWEEPGGKLTEETILAPTRTLAETVLQRRRPKKQPLKKTKLHKLKNCGDGTIPYVSLSWAHTWLLHATRAMRRHSSYHQDGGERISDDNALKSIKVSYRPKGGSEWIEGGKKEEEEETGENSEKDGSKAEDLDMGTSHPHGTKYKPEMNRFQSKGKSRRTGMEYTTTVIEAIGVEHKETTRNYDILAAAFTDVLKHMHDDFGLV